MTALYTPVTTVKLKKAVYQISEDTQKHWCAHNMDKSQNNYAESEEPDEEGVCPTGFTGRKLKKAPTLCSERKPGQDAPGHWAWAPGNFSG